MSDAEALCGQAPPLHQAGRLDEAEALYCQALAGAPSHFTARHMLGVLHHQQGRNKEALALLAAAAAAENPRAADARSNYGAVLKIMGPEWLSG